MTKMVKMLRTNYYKSVNNDENDESVCYVQTLINL